MTDFLDGLARAMARPMPRRQAMRVVGAAAAGVWTASSARNARASPGRAEHICDTRVQKEGWKYCTPASERCFPTCCPRDWQCCKGKCGDNGCCEMFCCNPCNPDSARCLGGGVCGRGPVSGARACGDKCCEEGETCADADLGLCCGIREQACKGGNTVSCCKQASQYCCSGTCCGRNTRCRPGKPGKCTPCPPKSKKCGKTCCIKGETCCNGKCCPKTDKCCNDTRCCKKNQTCCGERCCPEGARCCGEGCCRDTQTCCGEGCCNRGTTCYKVQGRFSCCPDERLAQTPAGKVCCPPYYYAEGDRCCRTGRTCTECDPPCPRGQYCQDGYCLQP